MNCVICFQSLLVDKSKADDEANPGTSSGVNSNRGRIQEPPSKRFKAFTVDTPRLSTTTETIENSYVCGTPCGHVFHRHCLKDWFTKNAPKMRCSSRSINQRQEGSCPICRKTVQESKLYPLYLSSSESFTTQQTIKSGKGDGDNSKTDSKTSNPETVKLPPPIHTNCSNEKCREVEQQLELLRQDFLDLKEKYFAERERAETAEAINKTLEDATRAKPDPESEPQPS